MSIGRLELRRVSQPRNVLLAFLVGLILHSIPESCSAGSATWTGTGGTVWSLTGNWSSSPAPGTGDTATFNNAGNANTTIDLGAGVTISVIVFDTASAAAYTIGSGAVGSQTLTLNDGGAIQMNSTVANSELLNTAITLGTAMAASYTFTNASASGTLNFAGNIFGGSGGAAGAKILVVSGAGNTTISGTVSNGEAASLALTKAGSGILTLLGSNTFSGGIMNNAGMLVVGNNSALGAGTLVMNGGLLSNALNNATLTNAIVFATTANIINTVTTTLSGPISGSGGLTLPGGSIGRLILSGSNTFAGSVVMTNCGGYLVIQNSMALGSNKTVYVQGNAPGQTLVMDGSYGNLTLDSNIVFQSSWSGGNGAISNAVGNNVINGNFTLTSGGGTTYLVVGDGSLTFNGTFIPNITQRFLVLGGVGKGIINGAILDGVTTNIMGVNKQEPGTWILAGTNTYSVATTVSGGKLVGVTGGSCSNSAITVTNASAALGVMVTDNTKPWPCAGLAFTAAGCRLDYDFGASVKPSISIAPLQVTNAVSFTTMVVSVNASTNLPAGDYPLMTWTSRSGTPPATAVLPPHVTGGSLSIIGTTLNLNIITNTQPLTWTNAVAGVWDTTAFSWKDSAGTSSRYQETLVGDLVVFDDTPGAGSSTVTLSSAVSPATVVINNTNRNYTLSGAGRITGVNGLVKSGAGTFTINTTNDYTGITTINAGTLAIGGNGMLYGGASRVSIANNGAFVYNSTATQTFYDAMSGTGSVTCVGSGTLIFAVASSYTGDTKITGGVLQVNQASLATNADVYVSTGGRLNLNFNGSNTIRCLHINGGTLSKGTYGATGSGAQTIRNDVFGGSGILNVALGAAGTVVLVE